MGAHVEQFTQRLGLRQNKINMYAVIHELVPTNEHLADIRLADTTRCTDCGIVDTLKHRITECGKGPVIWNCTRDRIAALIRVNLPLHTGVVDNATDFPHLALQKQAALVG